MIKKIVFVFILFITLMVFIVFENVFSEFSELYLPESEVTISLDFKDASLKDILKAFSIQSGLNFIASQTLQDRKITLYLDKVGTREVMDKLFKANNLSYELDEISKIIIVKDLGPPAVETITKIFTLKYASVSTSSLKEDFYNYIFATEGEEGKGGGAGGGAGKWKMEEVAGVTEAIKKLLSPPPVGSIIEEPRTNSLIITDIPSRFPIIEETIKRLDVSVPQVMLEVEMLDVSKGTVDKMGIKFGDITNYPSILTATFTGAARETAFPLKAFNPSDVRTANKFTPGSISFANSYRIVLEFIKAQTDTKILARPRILTLNNETAEIKITSDEVVGTKITKDADTGDVTTEETRASSFDVTKEGVGVFLRVTPQINLDTGEITMFIYPKVSNTRANSSFTSFRDPEARSTKSVVRVKDGQTVVVGGLIRNEKTEIITKLPILGDIPLLGSFFRHRERTKDEDRELLVFITPHILKDEQAQLVKTEKRTVSDREQTTESGFQRSKLINNLLNNFEEKSKKH